MNYNRKIGFRVGSHRRMFSRRSVFGIITGIIVGFNLASWLVIPTPSRTDIEIEVIAGDSIHGREDVFPKLRVGVARVRRDNAVKIIKSGRDCDHEVVAYRDNGNLENGREKQRGREKLGLQGNGRISKLQMAEKEANRQDDPYFANDFDVEAERLKRQKELEVFYESDIETEDDGGIPKDTKRLEDFQFPANAQKYVDYDAELSPDSNGRNTVFARNEKQVKISDATEQALNFKDRKHFIYIGVLTAQKYLATRGRAITNTWARKVPGKVEFYVGEGVKNVKDGEALLPLVNLPNVKDDAYPPQKKAFLMLKRMHDAYLNSGYQWFMRADDDIYIKTEHLENFLRKLNSSRPIFLGQTGLGNAEERGRLSLPHGDNYCMGGPGMIFSREVLRRVGPHIRECIKNLYSWHEDVELSRCVRRFADVNCAWSYQMQELFYEHYTLRKGYIDPHIDPNNPKLYSALTLHPNKNPQFQVKLHKFMRTQKMLQLLTKIREKSRDLSIADEFLGKTTDMEDFMLGIAPSLNRLPPKKRNDVRTWDFMTDKLWYSSPPNQARRSISVDKQITVQNIIMHVMRAMNANAKARGRLIEFNQVAYGYQRINPLFGAEYVLDLLLVYKRFKGRKVRVPVRRHAYLQQTFTKTMLHEPSPLDVGAIRAVLDSAKPGVAMSLLSSIFKRTMNIFSAFGLAANNNPDSDIVSNDLGYGLQSLSKVKSNSIEEKARKVLRYDSSKFSSPSADVSKTGVPVVHIIIPLKGRFDTFRSFMSNLEKVSLLRGDPVSLLIILFKSDDPAVEEESLKTTELLNTYARRYSNYDLRIIPITGSFSRGLGLEIGASHFSNDSLLFFCDIDVVFDTSFTKKCRENTALGSRVFYPVLFSQFHPDFKRVWSSRQQFPDLGINVQELQNASAVKTLQVGKDHFEIGESKGYWRSFGFGLLCTYKRDFAATGGFDLSIQGWGMEDVDLVDKFTTGGRDGRNPRKPKETQVDLSARSTISVFRTPEPSLVHVYHPSHCDVNLLENQLRMCKASRASGISSIQSLAGSWKSVKPEIVVDPVSEIIPMRPDRQHLSYKNLDKRKEKLNSFATKNKHFNKSDRRSHVKQHLNEKTRGIR